MFFRCEYAIASKQERISKVKSGFLMQYVIIPSPKTHPQPFSQSGLQNESITLIFQDECTIPTTDSRQAWFPSKNSVLSRYEDPTPIVGIDELCSSLTDDERKRVPVGTIGAFISDATQRAYPLTERGVNFLEGGSLRVQTKSLGTASSILPTNPDDGVKQSVREWYDKFGWQTNEQGFYNDTAIFSQATPTGHGLYELMSHLSILDRLAGGGFMLDAASGAIAHPEYLAFSWFFKSRVCVDMSITALLWRRLATEGFAYAGSAQVHFYALITIATH
jgi:hypothetical protein